MLSPLCECRLGSVSFHMAVCRIFKLSRSALHAGVLFFLFREIQYHVSAVKGEGGGGHMHRLPEPTRRGTGLFIQYFGLGIEQRDEVLLAAKGR